VSGARRAFQFVFESPFPRQSMILIFQPSGFFPVAIFSRVARSASRAVAVLGPFALTWTLTEFPRFRAL